MIWKFRYRKQAFSFLNGHDLLEPVRDKIASYISGERVDIKKLKGRWRGFLRLRIGKVRVVFKLDVENKIVEIYKAGLRGEIYKK
ncbi:MAG: type II toxin-antitoxin system RelE/ParE family toxin [Synergistetes bacterium]|nr:type II toxin-antitoxin system RelE/ParE family toxin [Synergistota bacterium]